MAPTSHCGQEMTEAAGCVPIWVCDCGREIPRGVPTEPEKHVVMFSGGEGSWAAAKRVAERYGTERLTLLFTDTLGEGPDLYRFLIEGAANIAGVDAAPLVRRLVGLPPITDETIEQRKRFLIHLWPKVMERLPILRVLVEGRDIWTVYRDNRFIGNSKLANCSKFLKQEPAAEWLEANTNPANTHVYVGIDWTEIHRLPAIVKAYKPWVAHAPLCEKPYIGKEDVAAMVGAEGIERARAYKLNRTHNNCAGFCVRAGHAQFAQLWRTDPEVYLYHELQEERTRAYLKKDVSVLRDRSGGESKPLTMRAFRERIEAQGMLWIDEDDIGGCGCFTAPYEDDLRLAA